MTDLQENISAEVHRLEKGVVAIRRDLHMYPELSGKEERTSSIVSKYLDDLGLEIRRCKKNYGVIGLLRGEKTGPTVALRADMDALALEEKTGLPFSSKVDGVMHACGHDVHTAILMGTAAVLTAIRSELKGNALFLFQPSEEFFPGGALGMIDEGALNDPKPDAIFSLHTHPVPVGKVCIIAGPIIGAVSTMSLRIFGRGGHFSKPHLAVDPIVAASHVVVALNSMMTRKVDPIDSAVLTFGMIQGGTRDNIIGDMVVLRGNIGSLDEGLCKSLMEELEKVVKGITEGMGATYKLRYIHGYPTTRNNPEMAEYVRNISSHVLGEQNVLSCTPVLGGEDFSFFLQRVPGAMFFLGTQNPEKEAVPIMNHDPRFNPDERAISIGMKVMAHLVMQYAAR